MDATVFIALRINRQKMMMTMTSVVPIRENVEEIWDALKPGINEVCYMDL